MNRIWSYVEGTVVAVYYTANFLTPVNLRNVAQTAPYFHDASAKTLEEAVDVMFKYQLGRTAPAADKELIVKFLQTLSGPLKADFTAVSSP